MKSNLGGGGGVRGRRAGLAALAGCLVLALCSQVPASANLWKSSQQTTSIWRLASLQLSGLEAGGGFDGAHSSRSPGSPPAMPRGPVGPRLHPWVQNRSCLVYILDGSAELAPYTDVESCNMSDPKVWRGRMLFSSVLTLLAGVPSFAASPCCRSAVGSTGYHPACLSVSVGALLWRPRCPPLPPASVQVLPPGKGVKAVNETARYNSLHGGPWWLTQALRNATGLLTSNLSEACMVWLDM